MNLKVKLIIDKESIKELEAEINTAIGARLAQFNKDLDRGRTPSSRLEDLIDVLIEKGVIQRSDLIG